MKKRPLKTAARSGRSIPERMSDVPEIPAGADKMAGLPTELRGSGPQHGLTLKEAMSWHASREGVSALPAAPAHAPGFPAPEPEPQVRRAAKALVPILADGALYLPGTDTEMVPLTFEAYGELLAARLIEPAPWGDLELASAVAGPDSEGAEP